MTSAGGLSRFGNPIFRLTVGFRGTSIWSRPKIVPVAPLRGALMAPILRLQRKEIEMAKKIDAYKTVPEGWSGFWHVAINGKTLLDKDRLPRCYKTKAGALKSAKATAKKKK